MDGTVRYTAQIRIKRDGAQVYQETQSFVRKQAAQAWIGRREAELYEPDAIKKANRVGIPLVEIIDRYLQEVEKARPLGKTKRATLKAISLTTLGQVVDSQINSQRLVEYALWRMSKAGGDVQPQTAANDMAHLGAVLSVAKPAWGYQVDQHAMADARKVLKKLGYDMKSQERVRRPTTDELQKLLEHFSAGQKVRPTSINMVKVLGFAMFSTRRQDEITRIRWADLDEEEHRIALETGHGLPSPWKYQRTCGVATSMGKARSRF